MECHLESSAAGKDDILGLKVSHAKSLNNCIQTSAIWSPPLRVVITETAVTKNNS
jgi:hypothetical protein